MEDKTTSESNTKEERVQEHDRPKHVIEEAHVLTEKEEEKVIDRLHLPATAVYAIVKEQGSVELDRPSASLFWSGIVAGIAMGFSILTLALFQMHLPDTPWAPLVSSLGYATGFLIVILGRQQLFTESTITAVLPLTAHPSWDGLGNMLRVWGVVLLANWLGCLLAAVAFVVLPLIPPDVSAAVVEASQHYGNLTAHLAFSHGIGAGFLVALMVWMMPSTEHNKFVLIAATGWLIALAGFTHVIAGMCEIAVLVFTGHISVGHAFFTLALPTLAGNILGGSGVFTVMAYAQVKNEVEQ